MEALAAATNGATASWPVGNPRNRWCIAVLPTTHASTIWSRVTPASAASDSTSPSIAVRTTLASSAPPSAVRAAYASRLITSSP